MVVAWWAEWLQSELRDTRAPLGGLPLQAVIVPAGYHGSARGPPGPRWHLALALGGAPWYKHHRALSRLLSTSTTWRTLPLRIPSPLGTTSVWGVRGFQGLILLRIAENL